PQNAEYWHQAIEASGALVVGRTLFDVTDGWGGRHPIDLPVVVVTHNVPTEWVEQHPDAPFTFVTEGVSAAVAKAKEIAGDKDVDVAAGTMATQALELGLLDEITVDIAPVVLGQGRPYFGPLGIDPVLLEDPTTVVQSHRALHLVSPAPRCRASPASRAPQTGGPRKKPSQPTKPAMLYQCNSSQTSTRPRMSGIVRTPSVMSAPDPTPTRVTWRDNAPVPSGVRLRVSSQAPSAAAPAAETSPARTQPVRLV